MRRLIFTLATVVAMFVPAGAQNCDTTLFPDGKEYYDTYHDIAGNLSLWKHYNTHDPTVNKEGEWYYMYSTDASWAGLNKNGALKRRSKDLVNWEFLGNAFNGVPQSAVDFFKIHNPTYKDAGIWAPFLLKYKDKYILYYSAPGGLNGVNYAFIGYATSASANGPWEDKGVITTSYRDTINAIDPSVIYDSLTHKLWMAYGSWERGINILELDTATGGIKTPGDRGVKICRRAAFSLGQEGPELTYRNGWYYLIVSYDGLGDLYNLRVGRSRTPNGPFIDFTGKDMAGKSNSIPMIEAPYRFNNHPGWQGTGHCGVYNDNGKYYIFNQARPTIEPAMMVLHVREIFWVNDWPLLSPERYAGVPHCAPIIKDSLTGVWEHLPLIYHVVATKPHSTSVPLDIEADGTFNSDPSNTWTFANDTLMLSWNNGSEIDKLFVFRGWDWENNCFTILYTGIDTKGKCLWGKKINQKETNRYTTIEEGATYLIRGLHSHMLMGLPAANDIMGASIKIGADNEATTQLWTIKNAGDGYVYLQPKNANKKLVLEVRNGSVSSSAGLIIDTLDATDKQKFKLLNNGNGFFSILTKITSDAKCAEVRGYSTTEGGLIVQNVFSKLLNQQWRFEKIDSVATDTTMLDTTSTTISAATLKAVQIYPNPSPSSTVSVDVRAMSNSNTIQIAVIDLKGVMVYSNTVTKTDVYTLHLKLGSGVYVVRVSNASEQYINRLIIQ